MSQNVDLKVSNDRVIVFDKREVRKNRLLHMNIREQVQKIFVFIVGFCDTSELRIIDLMVHELDMAEEVSSLLSKVETSSEEISDSALFFRIGIA